MGDLKYIGECAWVIGKYYDILYKDLERQDFSTQWGPETDPP